MKINVLWGELFRTLSSVVCHPSTMVCKPRPLIAREGILSHKEAQRGTKRIEETFSLRCKVAKKRH